MKIAFIIGCSGYDDPDIANLKYSDNDASDFAQTIQKNCGFDEENIFLLSGNNPKRRFWPTKSNIIRTLKPRREQLPRLNTLWFFFSGHGLHSLRDRQDYLVPQDAAANELEDSSIPFEKLINYLKGWGAENTVIFLDACRAVVQGGKAITVEAWEEVDVKALHSHGMASFCSCSPHQRSYESDELKKGLFTHGLCEAISDVGKCRTLYELDNYLVKRVPALCRQHGKPIQNPYTKIEPIGILSVDIISERRINEWQSSVTIGKEIRSQLKPSSNFNVGSGQLMCAIDFGTSFSTVALLDKDTKVTLIPSSKGRTLVPSVVSFLPNLDYVVGWDALENARINPENTVFCVKRFLGQQKTFSIHGKSFSGEFIASLIIRSLKNSAEEFANTSIGEALVSAPANFNIAQTNALVRAFELAGFKIYRVIGEPCASTVAFYSGFRDELTENEKTIVVLDLGGGTFDVSIMEVGHGVCETKAVVGDNELGGIDFDSAIFEYLTSTIRNRIPVPNYQFGEVDNAQVRAEAERVKVALGTRTETSVVMQNLEIENHDLLSLEITVDRDAFRKITSDLSLRCETCIQRAMKLAGLEPGSVDIVFLAGQGGKIFTVREIIEKLFPNVPIVNRFQETAVIQGLCAYTGVFRGLDPHLLLVDTNYCTIGIKCIDEKPLKSFRLFDPEAELLISGLEEENTSIGEILSLGTIIPTRKVYECKAQNVQAG